MLDKRRYVIPYRRVSQYARQGSCHRHSGRSDLGQAQSGPGAQRLLGSHARPYARRPTSVTELKRLVPAPHEADIAAVPIPNKIL